MAVPIGSIVSLVNKDTVSTIWPFDKKIVNSITKDQILQVVDSSIDKTMEPALAAGLLNQKILIVGNDVKLVVFSTGDIMGSTLTYKVVLLTKGRAARAALIFQD